MKLYVLPGNEPLGRSLEEALSAERGELSARRFPDGESHVRVLDEPGGQEAIVLCSLDRPDPKIMPLVLLASVLRELGARSVTLVAPYLAYMRQDHRFNPGEAVSAKHFARLLENHFDRLVTVDPHLHRIESLSDIYSIPADVAHSAESMSDWVKTHVQDAVLVGPDSESAQWVERVADEADVPWTVLEKERRGDRDVGVSAPELSRWPDRQPVLIDDIISTAHTMAEATRHIRAAGAGRPVCLATHAVFADDAWELLRRADAARIVTTNTITHPTNAIDMGPALAAAIRGSAEAEAT